MRNDMEAVYINKARQIINTGRLHEFYMSSEEKKTFYGELTQAVASKSKS
jgi:hypothetical protein